MYSLLRPLLFQLDAEHSHSLALSALHYLPRAIFPPVAYNPVPTLGLTFPHPVGLAAGLDKNGEHLDALAKIGFAFIELGTVTPRPQLGNPKPRLFRLPEDQAIINRMGFNNKGIDALITNVNKAKYPGILGINIGKNKDTPIHDSAADYLYCLQRAYPHASYITINISSPNTPDLRQLQQADYFADLLKQLSEQHKQLADQWQRHVPLLVKVSPDETSETLKQMTELILKFGVEGIIATNTTCSRDGINNSKYAEEQGGLSGKPVAALATQTLKLIKKYVGNQVALIGVGGIDDCQSAQAKLDAGATLIQVYSGLIYRGPGLVAELSKGISCVNH